LHDFRPSRPASGCLARSPLIECRQRPLLGRHIGLGVDAGGVQRHVAEPSPDRVDVDARLQQVRGGRMADYVRTDPLATKWRAGGPQLRDVALDHGMNAVTRDGLTTTVQEHMLVMGPFVGKATEVLDGVGPERATALLAPLAHDPDGPGVPVDVADPERCRLTHTRTGVVKEQQQGVIACSLARRSIGSGQQRIELRLLQVGDAGSDTFLDRHHPNLGAPFDVLWTVRTDEPGQSVYRAEALVPCGRGALPLALQMSEEGAN